MTQRKLARDMITLEAFDRAAADLPVDLQVVWMRFRSRVFIGYPTNTPERSFVCVYRDPRSGKWPHIAYCYGNTTWPVIEGNTLGIAGGIAEFFRDEARRRCGMLTEGV